MMPDPHCASCNGTFVEMIENVEDDPRSFQQNGGGPLLHGHSHGSSDGGFDDDDYRHDGPMGPDQALQMFQLIMGGLGGPQRRASIRIDRRTGPNIPDSTGEFRLGGGPGPSPIPGSTAPRGQGFLFSSGGATSFEFGSGAGASGTPPREGVDAIPALNTLFQTFPGGPPSPGSRGQENGPPSFLRNILMSMFGAPTTGGHDGQFGDYVLNNEALDTIISQLMEQSNSDKPVPAPDELIATLPRTVVEADSPLLAKDCAVCKDSFEVAQDTISLPCKHAFHDECILPWIKSSGTCPVCRYELVPQPKHNHGGPAGPSTGAGGGQGPSGFYGSPASSAGTGSSPTSSSGNRTFPGGWDALD